jgi:hypothetical protein
VLAGAGDPADGVSVEDGGGGGGAIHIPDSDASSVGCAHDPDVESGFTAVSGVAVEGFVGAPTTGGIPKPAGEVGFACAGAPPLAESVSNNPSGSNN